MPPARAWLKPCILSCLEVDWAAILRRDGAAPGALVGDSALAVKESVVLVRWGVRTRAVYPTRRRRDIRTLYNFDPPASEEEVRAAALQYVRKICGFDKPSRANEEAFVRAVEAVAVASMRLLDALHTTAPAKNREVEAAKAPERAAQRFAA
ncbi:MAG: DUF2277 domain-containing protein [Solirubrobacterales bacterium]|nr:DUF2277 domain-containing protein [Solirubrobacterales bacterium]MBV9810242.1 DUF2277 domain-containing protein [Solirubrobacterales bacterium]